MVNNIQKREFSGKFNFRQLTPDRDSDRVNNKILKISPVLSDAFNFNWISEFFLIAITVKLLEENLRMHLLKKTSESDFEVFKAKCILSFLDIGKSHET